jgi:phosphopantetheinyl transferase (holo-ACP synthase)
LKAIGTGLSGVPMTDIGVRHEASGQPRYALGPLAQAQLERLGAKEAFLSLSHEAGMAAAVCVIE